MSLSPNAAFQERSQDSLQRGAMIRICHIITGTDVGGAEMMLSKLAAQHDRSRFEVKVISLLPIGAIGERIAASGILVVTANMRRGAASLAALRTITMQIKAFRPDIVQTWMYHADLIGGMAAKQAGVGAIAWNICNSTLDPRTTKRSTLMVVRLCALMSRRIPRKIVCCSHVAQQVHTALGYDAKRMQVIPSGFDLGQFRPNAEARARLHAEWGLDNETLIIGLAARFHPQKDHANFVAAATLLHREMPGVHFVLCGHEIAGDNMALMGLICASGLASQFHLLGRRLDMPDVTAAFDLAASSSSYGEAFPNVLGEAMACGVPCVATDVGDSRLIIGETGICVPPKQPLALAEAWQSLLTETPQQKCARSIAARERVQAEFNLPEVVCRYEAFYETLLRNEASE